MIAFIGLMFEVIALDFGPNDIGFPTSRARKYMVAIRRTSWCFPEGFDAHAVFKSMFGRRLSVSGSTYMEDTSRAEVKEYIKVCAEKQHMVHFDRDGNSLMMFQVLPFALRQRIQENIATLKEQGNDVENEDWFFYICQRNGWGSRTESVPALLRKSKVLRASPSTMLV